MFSSRKYILENTVPLKECRGSQWVAEQHCLVCSTPDSEESLYEIESDLEEARTHYHYQRPSLNTPMTCEESAQSRRFSCPEDEDYFGHGWKTSSNYDEPVDEGVRMDMETTPLFRGEYSRQTSEQSQSVLSRISSCAPVSPTGYPQPTTYHQKNIPLPGQAITNSQPFTNESNIHHIPASTVLFDRTFRRTFETSNTIRIEFPAILGPHKCKQMYEGFKDACQSANYEVRPETDEPACIHKFFSSFSSQEADTSMADSISTASTSSPPTSVSQPPSLEFIIREDFGSKRTWSRVDLVHRDSKAQDVSTSFTKAIDGDDSATKEIGRVLRTPSANKFRKLSKTKEAVATVFRNSSSNIPFRPRLQKNEQHAIQAGARPTTIANAKRGSHPVPEGTKGMANTMVHSVLPGLKKAVLTPKSSIDSSTSLD